MIKATVLYGHPKDTDEFEKYYAETHLPFVSKTSGIAKVEFTKVLPNPDGSAPAYYRMAELYFEGPAEMQHALNSPEGKAMADDLNNFATGGVTIIFGSVE
ncbi:MAG: EthD family reductase [Niabella sp.]|nr:MAG: EthD family reductase [Niabella sp.]